MLIFFSIPRNNYLYPLTPDLPLSTQLTASDQDTGVDGDLTFIFVSVQSHFSITQSGNMAEVRLTQALDYDSGDTTFSMQVQATGGWVCL